MKRSREGRDGHEFQSLNVSRADDNSLNIEGAPPGTIYEEIPASGAWGETSFVRLRDQDGIITAWSVYEPPGEDQQDRADGVLLEAQTLTEAADGSTMVNGRPFKDVAGNVVDDPSQLHPVGWVRQLPGDESETGSVGPLSFFSTLQESEVILWGNQSITEEDGTKTTVYFQKPTPGSQVLRPGEHPRFAGIRSDNFVDKLNFLSLMLALFCGTASLPHILIRYYTVKDEAAARKSTIVGIGSIGFFYVLTLYLGLGAMTSGSLDVTDTNMAAPLLARSINEWLFAIISAIAFTTVLGTVSGLILASAGAVTHDLLKDFAGVKLNDHEQVRVAKLASVIVGGIAVVLGILFKSMNVGYLVGWAFSVAASANLPALVMLLFWKRTTHQGIIAAVVVGMFSSLGWILTSSDTFEKVYGYSKTAAADAALVPFTQPGIVTIPLGFATLVLVSLMTAKGEGDQRPV